MLSHKFSTLLLVTSMMGSLLSLSIYAQEIDTASAKKAIEKGAVIRRVTRWLIMAQRRIKIVAIASTLIPLGSS